MVSLSLPLISLSLSLSSLSLFQNEITHTHEQVLGIGILPAKNTKKGYFLPFNYINIINRDRDTKNDKKIENIKKILFKLLFNSNLLKICYNSTQFFKIIFAFDPLYLGMSLSLSLSHFINFYFLSLFFSI